MRWYERALADPTALSPGDRAKALAGLGYALVFLERVEQARAALIEALTLYRDAGDERGETLVLLGLGVAESSPARRRAPSHGRSRRFRSTSASTTRWGIAHTLHHIAEALRDLGDFERSAEMFARSIEIRRANGRSGAAAMHSLGDLYLDVGDMPTAERYYREALALGLQEGDVRLGRTASRVSPASPRETRTQRRPAACGLSPSGSSARSASGWSAAERVRYERNLTPPLTNTDEYRAGIADAANIDPLTAAAEIVNP